RGSRRANDLIPEAQGRCQEPGVVVRGAIAVTVAIAVGGIAIARVIDPRERINGAEGGIAGTVDAIAEAIVAKAWAIEPRIEPNSAQANEAVTAKSAPVPHAACGSYAAPGSHDTDSAAAMPAMLGHCS